MLVVMFGVLGGVLTALINGVITTAGVSLIPSPPFEAKRERALAPWALLGQEEDSREGKMASRMFWREGVNKFKK